MSLQTKRAVKRIAGVFLCLIFMLSMAGQGFAQSGRTVKLAYIRQEGFLREEADGSISGYGADYLNKISEYTGWDYEIVGMEGQSAIDCVKSGEVDLFFVARQTEARQTDCEFSSYPVINEQLNLYALPDSKLYYEDFEAFDGMRIGMPQTGEQTASLERYSNSNGFSYTLKNFSSNEAAIAALKNGEVDAVALMGYCSGEPLKMVGNFGVLPAYMMSGSKSALMQEFSDAQKQLYLSDPTFIQELEKKYFGNGTEGEDLRLTREEHEFIAAAGPLTVAMSVDMAPLEYYDSDSKSYSGITVDVFDKISKLTGLQFDFAQRGDAPELMAQMETGEIRLVGALSQSENVAKSLNIRQTDAFYDYSMSTVTRDFSMLSAESTVAVPAGYPQFVTTARSNGYSNVKEYATFEQCVKAVYSGEADLTYIISICEGYLLTHAQYSELRSVVNTETARGVCFGTARDDEVLLSILNKALSAIPSIEINEIIVSNTAKAVPQKTMGDILADNGAAVLLIALICFALISFAIVRWQKVRQQNAFTQQLQQHHDLLERLYESLPCGIFRYEYDPPHRIISYNAMCAKIYGFDVKDFTMEGSLPDCVVATGTVAAFQEQFDRCRREGKAITYVWPITRRDGSLAYTESVMDIVETAQGNVFQELITDVTERVLKEQENEKRYALEVHKSGNRDKGMIFMAIFDVTERTLAETDIPIPGIHAGISISQFKDVLCLHLGPYQTEDELDYFISHFSPERMEKAYDEGQFEKEITLRRSSDGQMQWLRSSLSLRYNPSTGHLMCFDYVWDVTDEILAAEIAQHTAFADFESYLSVNTGTGCCLQYDVDASGRRSRREMRYGETDIISSFIRQMSAPEAEALIESTKLPVVEARLAEKPSYQVFATLLDQSGLRRDKSISFFYLNKEFGVLAATVADVTEVRAAEVKHAQLLSDALSAAEKADAAKSQFLSRVSHEIRTPLNAVIGYGTIARNEMSEAKTDEERRQADMKVLDCLTKSDVASKHLLTIINDVLDMSAIESGKITIARDKFDFKGLITSLTTIFYSQARAKAVDLLVRFDAQMEEWVIGDQMRVNQVLTNLLSNAVKFTPEGGNILLSISPVTLDDVINVTFTVKDTGIGMSEEFLSRIWEPFEQADAYISRRFGGTGLGLSITKTLVDLMGGSIAVKSKATEGSEFTVELGFRRTEQPEDHSVYDFSGINALIVDDDTFACDYLQLLLSRSNVRNTAVNSGEAALAAVSAAMEKGDGYTVCFVDWRMPRMDGLETAQRIRELAGDDMPIIVITAYDFSEVAGKTAELGVNRFLSKPLFQSSLFNLLAELCGSSKARDAEELSTYDFTGSRILLAEDNAMNMEIASRLLEAVGLTVDRAWNGKEAVDVFEAAPAGTYKAILMDVQMPVMDGYQATKAIRSSRHPDAESIPIIAMTADAFAENKAEALSTGMNAHVAKPIDLPTLFETLGRFIQAD